MTSLHVPHQDVNQAIAALHPAFENLRFVTKDIEQEINLNPKPEGGISALLNKVKEQIMNAAPLNQPTFSAPKG